MKISKNQIFSLYIPYAIFVSTSFNSILLNFNIPYLYAFLIISSIFFMLIGDLREISTPNYLILSFYISWLVIVYIIQKTIFQNQDSSIFSLGTYIIMIIYWSIYFNKYDISAFKKLLASLTPIVFIIATLAYVQFFLSPSLFGLVQSDSLALKWAETASFQEYAGYLRAFSTLGSPQVYGTFFALYIVVLHSLIYRFNFSYFLLFSYIFFSGFLSGAKIFILITFLYAFKNLLKYKKYPFYLIFLLIPVITVFIDEDIRVIQRIISIDSIYEEEKSGRLLIYSESIHSINNYLIGDGFGIKSNRGSLDLTVVESYLLQIFYETGAIAFLAFIVLLLMSYKLARDDVYFDIKFIILGVIISTITSHTFNSPAMFLFWGFIVYPYFKRR